MKNEIQRKRTGRVPANLTPEDKSDLESIAPEFASTPGGIATLLLEGFLAAVRSNKPIKWPPKFESQEIQLSDDLIEEIQRIIDVRFRNFNPIETDPNAGYIPKTLDLSDFKEEQNEQKRVAEEPAEHTTTPPKKK